MATRTKLSVKPAAQPRNPMRPRVRAVNAPKTVKPPSPTARPAGDQARETDKRAPRPRSEHSGHGSPQQSEVALSRDIKKPVRAEPEFPNVLSLTKEAPPPAVQRLRQAQPERKFRVPQVGNIPQPGGRAATAGNARQGKLGEHTSGVQAPRSRVSPGIKPVASTPANPSSPSSPSSPASSGVRISKLITERGLASRREADDWIAAGWVQVHGQLAVLGQRVASDAAITIDPRARAEQARFVTILLNKPMGYVSGQAEDGHEPAITLLKPQNRWTGDHSRIDFHPGHLRHLAPAGRLDIDSTGLIVFTQDGRVAKRLIGDQTRVEKEYLVRVARLDAGALADVNLGPLRQGLSLDGILLRPAQVSWQNEDQLRFVLREGRKRQIRRMCEQVGLQVLGLKRVRIGSVPLSQLPSGQWRYLRDDERF